MIVPSYLEIAYQWNPLMDHCHEMPPLILFLFFTVKDVSVLYLCDQKWLFQAMWRLHIIETPWWTTAMRCHPWLIFLIQGFCLYSPLFIFFLCKWSPFIFFCVNDPPHQGPVRHPLCFKTPFLSTPVPIFCANQPLIIRALSWDHRTLSLFEAQYFVWLLISHGNHIEPVF